MKAYYLIQLAAWIHQIFVLHAEARRKDHLQMLAHHAVTCVLMAASYVTFYTRAGHVVLMLMDGVDAELALAKLFNYAGLSTLCDAMFIFFMLSWIACRHGLFNYLVYSAITADIPEGCYYDKAGELVRCYSSGVHTTLVVMLGILQVITIMWFALIVRIAWRVIKGTANANDDRSDDEDSD